MRASQFKFSAQEVDKATTRVCGREAKTKQYEVGRALLLATSETRVFKKIIGREVAECLAQDDSNDFTKRMDAVITLAMAVGYEVGRNRGIQ
jgi:hypothetical protein